MKPFIKFLLGMLIAMAGLLIVAFCVKLAVAVSDDHATLISFVAAFTGIVLICLGIWQSGIRIKFPPKNDVASN
jgi:hypothetical protein